MRNILRRAQVAVRHAAPIATMASFAVLISLAAVGVGADDKSTKDKRAGHEEKRAHNPEKSASPTKHVTADQRLSAIRTAQVWKETRIANVDLRAGPQDPGAFAPNELVTCDYVPTKRSGNSPKFECETDEGEVLKVKYGDQGEVFAEVVSTRLLWALGFPADRMYSVRVKCRGCSKDPWSKPAKTDETTLFDPAAVERKLPGHAIETDKMKGWTWQELVLVDELRGGAPMAQRQALTLLAVFIQHSDSKPENQRLLCPPGAESPTGVCAAPLMMVNDLGQTFGRANVFNRDHVSGLNFDEWSKVPIWRDEPGCVGHLSRSNTGTLEDPPITESGRAFLARLLVQLTDKQLHDLFEASRVELRSRKPGSDEPPASVDEWVAAFKHKREEIVNRRCGA